MQSNLQHENYQLAVSEFQQNTFRLIVFTVAGLVWGVLVLARTYTSAIPLGITGSVVLVELVCGIAYLLHARHPRLAAAGFIAGLWLGNLALIYHLDAQLGLYLFAVIILLAYSLSNLGQAALTALVSSVFVLADAGQSLTSLQPATARPLIVIWCILLAGAVTFNTLRRAFEVAWNYQNYAVKQMDNARNARAELARMTQSLQITQRNLDAANIQLKQTLNLAERARYLKAQFAANVSHELRTPINLIVGFSEMVVLAPEAYGVDLPLAYRADIHAIYRNARHLQNLINDILDISRIEAGHMTIVKEEVDVHALIEATATIARDMIEHKGLAFIVEMPPALPLMWLDRTRIMQTLLNLLANATRFTQQGGITLAAALDAAELRISVADTGIGIASENQERIFEEFFQVGELPRSELDGTGLGLSLSRQFVRLHGGYLTVESTGVAGKGSIFTLGLPLSDPVRRADLPVQAHTPPVDGTQCVIIVDQDPTIRQIFKGYIEKHTVLEARTLGEMIDLVAQIKPAAVVLEQSADHAAQRTAIAQVSPQTAVVLCPLPRGKAAAQPYGVRDYLVKPVARDDLLASLEQLDSPVAHVLIIDDNPDLNSMFARMLRSSPAQYRVAQAYTGEDGLMIMRTQRPDAIILDIVMPDIDGFTVIQRMQADPFLASIPVILVSAHGIAEADTIDAQGVISIYKPGGFQSIEVVNCVDAVVAELVPAGEAG